MKRILIKLSGEMFVAPKGFGIDYACVKETARNLSMIHREGLELAVVMGGGNIFRGIGLESSGMARTPADQMGMLATLMNGISLKTALEEIGGKVRLFTALDCPKVAESYQYDRARAALKSGEMILFVGGTGNPYFTTDTCAALRAAEMQVDLLIKATKVDGVYDSDPHQVKEAKKFVALSWNEFLDLRLRVMDLSAVALCMSAKIPIFVCNMALLGKSTFENLLENQQGTLIKG